MAIFRCDYCDNFVDSDEYPEIEYEETSDSMKCQNCIELENDDK